MRLSRKLWKCSQRGLKEDNTLGGVPFYESKLLVSCIRMCHDPIGHIRHTSNSQPLQPMATFYLWNERLIFTSEEVPAAKEVFASTADLCSVNSSLSPLLWNYKIAVTFCVSCPRWYCYSFLWYWPVWTNTFIRSRILTEGSRYRYYGVRYSKYYF